MKKISIIAICFISIFMTTGCGKHQITNEEIQEVRNQLAGEWIFADDYKSKFINSDDMDNYTIVIFNDGTFHIYKYDNNNCSDTYEYFIEYNEPSMYDIDFIISEEGNNYISAIYNTEVDSIYTISDTTFTVSINDVMERK